MIRYVIVCAITINSIESYIHTYNLQVRKRMATIGTTTIQITEVDSEWISSKVKKYEFKSKAELISVMVDYSVDNRGTKSLHEYIIKQFPDKKCTRF
jgi:hypothetical protein